MLVGMGGKLDYNTHHSPMNRCNSGIFINSTSLLLHVMVLKGWTSISFKGMHANIWL